MKIYTKKGDRGETSLFRGGRVRKYSDRVSAYGTVDELNCYLGWVRTQPIGEIISTLLLRIQNDLFSIGSDLATPEDAVKESDKVLRLPENSQEFMEQAIDEMEMQLEPLKQFIIPGGTAGAAALHVSRTICRRAERLVVQLASAESVNAEIIIYLNRLSDLLFVMARLQNKLDGASDVIWKKL